MPKALTMGFDNLNQVIDFYALQSPNAIAMLQHEDDKKLTYEQFANLVDLVALRLLDVGLKKGDIIATQLVLISEHVILMYACFKIGVIIAPLDVRLKPEEIVRDINKIQPKLFFSLGKTPLTDFNLVAESVDKKCASVQQIIQFIPPNGGHRVIKGAIAVSEFLSKSKLALLKIKNFFTKQLSDAYAQIEPRTPALIIYTTGTTGAPKPALLCHENILVQNEILSRGVSKIDNEMITMVNLPPSHVGCVTETLMTTFYQGGKAVLLKIFDVEDTLSAIEKHSITLLGQIPTQFRMLWAHPKYQEYDLSSLKSVVYAGSTGDLPFLKRLAKMAPNIGTGLGMTENAGFATFSRAGVTPEQLAGQVGSPFNDLAKVTIRKPINADGSAGEELPIGESGEICYHPPIVFLGYYNQPTETSKAISNEGILYTGDLGYFEKPSVDSTEEPALYLSGRRKFVIKQKGYNVFPTDVEEHLVNLKGVEQVEVVGVKHEIFDEGIFAFVKLENNSRLTRDKMHLHYKHIASYKRPIYIEILPVDFEFTLTRSAKIDKLALQELAKVRVKQLQQNGGWDV
ncbi:MAG: acyl--CoA ligase [Kangiellaceae bacterium]|nr:acyl--CoA ligase [Kangiellaceae bacterium]